MMDKRRSYHYNAALKLATVNDKLIEDNATLAARVEELEAALSTALDAMIWTTGSYDFAPEGKAREVALKILYPAIEKARKVLPKQAMEKATDENGDNHPRGREAQDLE